jgi:hypothetical protein
MAEFKIANLDPWINQTENRITFVLREGTNSLLKGIKVVPGIARGGSRKKGTIPRDLSALAGSLQSSVLGSSVVEGERSYVLAIGSFSLGQVATFSWGGDNAPYAKPVHYGANGVKGTLWIPEAAKKWQGYIDAATKKGKAVK